MTAHVVRRVLLVCALLAIPAFGYAQEAVLTGTVTDSTGAVLPGVTVVAVHEATGNRFEAVTDQTGIYRIPARVGGYQITAELQGFATVTRTGVQLLVGQTGTINLQMAPSTVQETVTVTAEAPLLETTTSSLGGNIDPQQVQELPVSGRNWMQLALLAPGNRSMSTTTTPISDRGEVREFQLNMDGQQVTANLGTGGQPRYSQDAIAEFQFISNRFDATQGRSFGVQVNAITRSGTNQLAGSFRGNFRDSRFNAADPIFNRVVPGSNQQLSGTIGGPIVRDKLHFFGNYEYERSPRTSIWNTPYPAFNIELNGNASLKLGGARLDYQLSPQMRVMGKYSKGLLYTPFGAGSNNNHPANTNDTKEDNNDVLGQFTQVLSNRALNEVKVGYANFYLANANLTTWSNHWQSQSLGVTTGGPRIQFTGFNITGNQNHPRHREQRVYMVRDNFTLSYNARGRHDLKVGGEFLYDDENTVNCQRCGGLIDARRGPAPANIESLFPDWKNADTWNLAALSPLVRRYTLGIGSFPVLYNHKKSAAWLQDDWQFSDRLTLNLGLRYDLSTNAFANDADFPPFVTPGRPDDTNNIQPRLGFAYRLNDRTVLRGGTGHYYQDPLTVDAFWTLSNLELAIIAVENDGRPDFAANPFNGPRPTYEQAITRFCYVRNVPGCLVRDASELVAPEEYMALSRNWQNSIGIQRQFGETMALEADYVYTRGKWEKQIVDNINLTFNPATGANYPFQDVSRRAFPEWGVISMIPHTGRSSYHGLQMAYTKRMSNRWQAAATYTLSGIWDADPQPFSGLAPVPFAVAPDLGNEFTLGSSDQRHRGVFSGIWQVGGGFQMSAIHIWGSGERSGTTYGGDLRNLGAGGTARLRPDGSIVPRNNFVQPMSNRTDIRFQQRIPLGGRVSVDGIAEVFNAFNRPNWGIETEESAGDFGERVSGQNRTMQFGFRLTF